MHREREREREIAINSTHRRSPYLGWLLLSVWLPSTLEAELCVRGCLPQEETSSHSTLGDNNVVDFDVFDNNVVDFDVVDFGNRHRNSRKDLRAARRRASPAALPAKYGHSRTS
jgi:hypothetical protein